MRGKKYTPPQIFIVDRSMKSSSDFLSQNSVSGFIGSDRSKGTNDK